MVVSQDSACTVPNRPCSKLPLAEASSTAAATAGASTEVRPSVNR
jgi:hypothetical protein